MRIISPFHDYYDSAMATGADDRSVFLRQSSESVLPSGHAMTLWDHPFKVWVQRVQEARIGPFGSWQVGKNLREKHAEPGLVMFAGQAYPFMAVRDATQNAEPAFVWTLDELIEWLDAHGEKLGDRRRFWGDQKTEEERMKGWFARRGANVTDVMARAQVALALIEDHDYVWGGSREPGRLVVNPCLAPYGFARQLDPWSAYQELSMFVEGVLRHPDPVTEPISDKDRLVQHGFDHWSFRKPPQPKDTPAPRKPRRVKGG